MRTMRAFPSVTSAVHSAVGLLALSTAICLPIAPVFVSLASACAPAPMLAVDTPFHSQRTAPVQGPANGQALLVLDLRGRE